MMGFKTLPDSQAKFQFKKKNYFLIDSKVGRTINQISKPIAYLEQFYEIIYEVHSIKRGHLGVQKTFDQLLLRFGHFD